MISVPLCSLFQLFIYVHYFSCLFTFTISVVYLRSLFQLFLSLLLESPSRGAFTVLVVPLCSLFQLFLSLEIPSRVEFTISVVPQPTHRAWSFRLELCSLFQLFINLHIVAVVAVFCQLLNHTQPWS